MGLLLSGGSTSSTAPVKFSLDSILTAEEKENDHIKRCTQLVLKRPLLVKKHPCGKCDKFR